MRIHKISASHLVTDQTKEVFEREFAPIKARRNSMIAKATKAAEALGHRLFRNWTPGLNSNRCRKCGMTVSLPNVYGKFAASDAVGAAVMSRCSVQLEDADWTFDVTDRILDEGVPINRDQLTAIAVKRGKTWKEYPDIPSFVRDQDLAGAFEGIYGKPVEEYCGDHMVEKGLKDLAMGLGSDLGFEVRVSRGRLFVNIDREQAYEQAFPRDSVADGHRRLPVPSDDDIDAIVGNDTTIMGGSKMRIIRLSQAFRFPNQCPNCSYVNVCHKNSNKNLNKTPAIVAPPIDQVTEEDSPVSPSVDDMIDAMLHKKSPAAPARDPHEEHECGDFIPKDYETRNMSRSY